MPATMCDYVGVNFLKKKERKKKKELMIIFVWKMNQGKISI